MINGSLSTVTFAQTTLKNTNATIKIEGGFLVLKNTKLINDNDFNASGGTVLITGDATDENASISGLDIPTFYNLQINKTSNGALVENEITVSNELILTNGNLIVQSEDLIISSSGSISGGSANSYIQTTGLGVLNQRVGNSNIVFPVGNQSYTPVTLNNSGVNDGFKVRVENEVYQNGTSGNAITTDVVDATWHISQVDGNGVNVTATFQWNASDELTNFDRTQSFVSYHDNGIWNNGTAAAASGSNPYTLSASNITILSPFIIASDANVLPVELLYFYGEKVENGVLLSWETATEINNDYFDVEYSLDGINFEKIGRVQGAGTTTENQLYEFLHNPSKDVAMQRLYDYYRLKQVDLGGKYEYTNIVLITIQQSNNSTIKLFPNPTSDFINIKIDDSQIGEIKLQIIDIRGRILKEYPLETTNNQYSVTSLPAGTYFVRIGKQTQKLVKL